MTTLEIVFGSITAGFGLVSLVFGGGILNRFIKHSNDLAVTQYILAEQEKKLNKVILDVANLQSESVEVSTKVDQFAQHIRKLDLIPTLDAKLTAMTSLVDGLKDMVSSLATQRHNK